jgi:putative ABC transport system permease protein
MIIAIGAMLSIATSGATQNMVSAVHDNISSLGDVGYFVQVSPSDELPVSPVLPAQLSSTLAAVPGVARVVPGQFAYAAMGSSRVLLEGLGGPSGTSAYHLASASARQAMLDGSAAVVSRKFAQDHDLSIGSSLALATPSGTHQLPVADIIDYVGLDDGLVAVSLGHLAEWYHRDGATFFEITMAPGANPDQVRAALLDRAGSDPNRPVYVFSGTENVRGAEAAVAQASALSLAIQWVIAVAAGLAVLTTFLLAVRERQRELGILRATGASRRLVRRTVLAEAGAVGITGVGVGIVTGLLLHYLATLIVAKSAALQIPFHVVPLTVLLAVVALGLSLVGALPPARAAARLNIIEAIGYE